MYIKGCLRSDPSFNWGIYFIDCLQSTGIDRNDYVTTEPKGWKRFMYVFGALRNTLVMYPISLVKTVALNMFMIYFRSELMFYFVYLACQTAFHVMGDGYKGVIGECI